MVCLVGATVAQLVNRTNLIAALRRGCAKDLQTRCTDASQDTLISCLQKERRKKALSSQCSAQVFGTMLARSANFSLNFGLQRACLVDVIRIGNCSKYLSTYQCVKANRAGLSRPCRSSVFKWEQDSSEDLRLNRHVHQSCRREATQLCNTTDFGHARVFKCLWMELFELEKESSFGTRCRNAVKQMTVRTFQDYRLDYRIRTACQGDIDTICRKERLFVDSLGVAALSNASWHEHGTAGTVLQCLKANYTKIADAGCKQEVGRMVRAHALTPTTDALFQRVCAGDVKRFNCSAPTTVRFCLIAKLPRLSGACRKSVMVQGILGARDINLRPRLWLACAAALKKYCKDVPRGYGRQIACLEDHVEELDEFHTCKKYVGDNLEMSSHDWRLKFGISTYCADTAKKLCTQREYNNSQVLGCLKSKFKQIEDKACDVEMRRYIKQGSNNIKAASGVYTACMSDVKEFCADVDPGNGRVHKCLLRKNASITLECARAEFHQQMLEASDIRMNPRAELACRPTSQQLCATTDHGRSRMWNCLEKNVNDERMEASCRTVITAHIKMQNYNFRLNPQLSRNCGEDAAFLCPAEVVLAEYEDFSSEGAVLNCLIMEQGRLTSKTCKQSLRQKVRQRLSNIKYDPVADVLCGDDVDKFCRGLDGKGNGVVHTCLQSHLPNLTFYCKNIEFQNMIMASSDIRLNPGLQRGCKLDIDRFCKDMTTANWFGGHVIICLLKHMHHIDMSFGCTVALEAEQTKRTKNINFNPLLNEACRPDLQRIRQNHSKEAVCQTVDIWEMSDLNGKYIACLLKHRSEVMNPNCRKHVIEVLQRQSNDVRANPFMTQVCQRDMNKYCASVPFGKGQKHKCLRDHIKELDKQCAFLVSQVWAVEAEDATVNPQVARNCRSEMRSLCNDVEHGQSRMLVCLKLQQQSGNLTRACSDALGLVPLNMTKVKGSAKNEITKFAQRYAERFGREWGKVVVTGIVAVTFLCFSCMVYSILRMRWSKEAYNVMVEHAEAQEEPPTKLGKQGA